MSAKKDYFDFSEIVSLVLAVIPFTAWIFGVLTRFKEEKYVATVIRVFFGLFIWIPDVIFMLTEKHIFRYLDK